MVMYLVSEMMVFELDVIVHSAYWHSITRVPRATIVFMNNTFELIEFSLPFSILPLLLGESNCSLLILSLLLNSSIFIISNDLVCSIELICSVFSFFQIILIIFSDMCLNS